MSPDNKGPFQIVVSEENHYSLWTPSAGDLPHGWVAVEGAKSNDECLKRLRELQPDPLLRKLHPTKKDTRPRSTDQRVYSTAFPNPDSHMQLIVFPHAGAGTAYYHFLAKELSKSNIEVRTVAYPGRETRISQPACTTLSALINDISPALEQTMPENKCVVFYGHSMGALVAFELARHWRDLGIKQPYQLICSGRQAPSVRGNILDVDPLSNEEFLQEVIERYQAIPKEILQNEELLELILPSLRADFSVVSRYVYRKAPPLDCPIVLFNGKADPWVDNENLAPWQQETHSLTSNFCEGGHFFLQSNVALLHSHLVECKTGAY